MKVLSTLLLSIVTIVSTQQHQECLNGQLQQTISNILEYCYHGEWRWICLQDSQWNHERTIFVCTQLGYSGSVRANGPCGTTQRKVVTLTNCSEPGQHLTECMVTASDNCITCSYLSSTCFPALCTDGEIRLVDGSTDREGRVEVCANRRWRTVCTGSQELAGAFCSQMGYIFEASAVALLPKTFPPGAFPEYRLDCTQLSNRTWHCSPVEEQCDSFVELGVVCKNYEDLYNDCSRNCTTSILPVTTKQSPTNKQVTIPTDDASFDNSTTIIAGIGVLVVLLLVVSVGWIVSCVILLRRGQTVHKQHVDAGTISTRSNQNYTQQDINTQLYAEATPPDTTYSRLNRGDKQTEEIATYDYADPNQIRVECSQATNPPPVSGEAIMREEEFYIAEDHTYAAVNKKPKKKKKPKNAESDGEGESEATPPFVSTLAEV
ncbi:deleted in malignant brain tumors 1 protein-like isoform X2 [Halichondria panicea]|uniref:deleted in malignant brain tumors 1 protein-like isoform X2 n=1 Tax=Halichondria panicea TaxID=6063 RepID=UPI00312B68F5